MTRPLHAEILLNVDRDSGIAGEVIQRAKRQNTERHAGARHDACNGVERPITASCDQYVGCRIQRLLGCGNELAPVMQQMDLHMYAVLREIPNDILTQQLLPLRAGATVQEYFGTEGRVHDEVAVAG